MVVGIVTIASRRRPRGLSALTLSARLLQLDPQPMSHAGDEVEVSDDLRRREDGCVAPACGPKRGDSGRSVLCGTQGELTRILYERAVRGGDGRCGGVARNGVRERVVMGGAAETRRVMGPSIVAVVGLTYRHRDELPLRPAERVLAEHQLLVEGIVGRERPRRQGLCLEDVGYLSTRIL